MVQPKTSVTKAKYHVGQVIHHCLFGYRGVIIDVDPHFMGTEDWYSKVASSRPPRDRPWYHVLVDGGKHQTYVAERNLEPDQEGGVINHPDVSLHFKGLGDGFYHLRARQN